MNSKLKFTEDFEGVVFPVRAKAPRGNGAVSFLLSCHVTSSHVFSYHVAFILHTASMSIYNVVYAV